ncbi:hypothetical protein [Ferviditalea candida]|uniref:Uncharacterized protein n=1 Tax=Ferviditalea candida TaxID=3108399 RepID=A0ABU5ZGR4_9BACL|nr:hypothetical protein [Paenibacillaceae bacterium T2]
MQENAQCQQQNDQRILLPPRAKSKTHSRQNQNGKAGLVQLIAAVHLRNLRNHKCQDGQKPSSVKKKGGSAGSRPNKKGKNIIGGQMVHLGDQKNASAERTHACADKRRAEMRMAFARQGSAEAGFPDLMPDTTT